jgi:hypothetical protein
LKVKNVTFILFPDPVFNGTVRTGLRSRRAISAEFVRICVRLEQKVLQQKDSKMGILIPARKMQSLLHFD